MARGDMEFLFECSTRYRVEQEKFRISKQPCIILFIV